MKKTLFVLLFMVALLADFTPTFAASPRPEVIKPLKLSSYRQVRECNHIVKDSARCLAIELRPNGIVPDIPAGLNPANLRSAYNLPVTNRGGGQTVALIDAYDNPHAEADMAVYRSMFGLPACTTANGCFKKVDQTGGTSYPQPDNGWASEIALDIDMVSAIAPASHILLIEAKSSSFRNLGTAVNTAVSMGATEISNSYGGAENASSAWGISLYYKHPGVVITASAGDNGYGVQFPASFSTVVAVGGTTLRQATNKRGWNETAWSGSGSGCSLYISKPHWQHDRKCSKRAIADVSAVADPTTGVSIYNTYGGRGWGIYGGTSAASPIIAAVYALAGNATRIDGSYLYDHTNHLNDVLGGKNGDCSAAYLCSATKGYDGPTGLGTPNGIDAF